MPDIAHGWVSQPDGRGTFDIIQNCLASILICSWSTLFLNLPGQGNRRLGFAKNKSRWMIFAIFFPEVITGVAAEQWRSASQSVEDFAALLPADSLTATEVEIKSGPHQVVRQTIPPSVWTMRHAFFADMGGIHISCPDSVSFPIDGQQLVYLVKNRYLEYPDIDVKTIWDRNKADSLARVLALLQIVWFTIQAIARCVQHLALSTFELSTLAFVFCTMNTLYFWWNKPLDAESPIVLHCPTRISEIIAAAGAPSEYTGTPLDFIRPPTTRASLMAPFWFAIRAVFDWRKRLNGDGPSQTFGNVTITPPRGINTTDFIYGVVFELSYFGIYLAGWNFHFPTPIERRLWRTACLILPSLMVLYLFGVALGTVVAGSVAKAFFKNSEATTIIELCNLLPRWIAIAIHLPIIAVYIFARAYIIVEGFVSLRAMPVSAFASINWSNFVPHF